MTSVQHQKSTDNLYSNEEIVKSDGKYCYSFLPARYVFVFLGFYAFVLVYAYKVVLSVTIVAMVSSTANNSDVSHYCRIPGTPDNTSHGHGHYDWGTGDQNHLLGAFFYGYVITQLPAGILSQRYGSKWIFGISLFGTCICTLLGPLAAEWGFIPFLISRVGAGLGEGVAFPCMAGMFGRWIPKMERSLMATIVYTGAQIGTVITLPLGGFLSEKDFMGGWKSIYYILGIAGCIWFALWALLIHETPDLHPHISRKEYEYIKMGQGEERSTLNAKVPWKEILTSWPLWALTITHFGNNWGFLTILTELPTYFKNILLMDIKKNGAMSALPYLLAAICGWGAGFVSDKVRRTGKVRVNVIRKVCNSIAFIGPGLCLIGVARAGDACNTTLSIVLFTAALGFNGFVYSGFMATHVDMAPDFAGTLMGITNTVGNICGFLAPEVVAALTKGHTTDLHDRWSIVFYISSGIFIAAAIVYVLFASAELQPWGLAKRDEINANENSRISTISNSYSDKLAYYNSVDANERL